MSEESLPQLTKAQSHPKPISCGLTSVWRKEKRCVKLRCAKHRRSGNRLPTAPTQLIC